MPGATHTTETSQFRTVSKSVIDCLGPLPSLRNNHNYEIMPPVQGVPPMAALARRTLFVFCLLLSFAATASAWPGERLWHLLKAKAAEKTRPYPPRKVKAPAVPDGIR